jgi:two-component system LytT family response regulator
MKKNAYNKEASSLSYTLRASNQPRTSEAKIISLNSLKKCTSQAFIKLPNSNGTLWVLQQQICLLKGEGNYTQIHLANDHIILVCKPLKFYREQLDDQKFIQVHKSYLIQKNSIEQVIEKDQKFTCKLKIGQLIPVSRRKKQTLIDMIS